jgi:hypothetical protein
MQKVSNKVTYLFYEGDNLITSAITLKVLTQFSDEPITNNYQRNLLLITTKEHK